MIVNSTRQVITRSPHRTVGTINSPYFQDKPIVYESQLERAFVQLCLVCPGIKRIVAQPFKVNLDPTKKRHYTPDYLVELEDGSFVVIEVKILERIAKLERRFNQINEILSSRHFSFITADETQLYSDEKKSTLKKFFATSIGKLIHKFKTRSSKSCKRLMELPFHLQICKSFPNALPKIFCI